MKPVLQIEPVKLNGATITNVFADNVRFLYDYGLGIGSNIEVKRSGGIIPRVSKVEGIDVIPAKEMKKIKDKVANSFIMVKDVAELNGLPNNFKIPNYKDEQCFWDSSKIELIIPNADNDDEVKLQRIIFFFETIGVENVSDKTFRYLYSQGYDTIKKVLEMNAAELTNFEGFGESKSEIVVKSIQRAWSKVKFIKLLYATNYFSGMGEDKINLIINHFKNKTIYELSKFEVVDFQVVTGIAEITAKIFKDNIIKASDFILELGWTAEKEIEEKPKEIAKSGICLGWTCCFTKFRDKVLEKAIVENGGTVIDKFNNSITHVFIENNSISSVKVDKAREKGCVIMTKEELYNFLGIKDENQKEQGLF
jgi:NAD-dependent DNA ligase